MFHATVAHMDGTRQYLGLYPTREEAAAAAAAARTHDTDATMIVAEQQRQRETRHTTRHNAPALWDMLNPSR